MDGISQVTIVDVARLVVGAIGGAAGGVGVLTNTLVELALVLTIGASR